MEDCGKQGRCLLIFICRYEYNRLSDGLQSEDAAAAK